MKKLTDIKNYKDGKEDGKRLIIWKRTDKDRRKLKDLNDI